MGRWVDCGYASNLHSSSRTRHIRYQVAQNWVDGGNGPMNANGELDEVRKENQAKLRKVGLLTFKSALNTSNSLTSNLTLTLTLI